MILVEERHLKIIKSILAKYPYQFYAFGSRVKGNLKKFSDLDLCFFDNIPWNERAHIKEDFEESNLPFKVDIIDWNLCDDKFKERIKPDLEAI